ncbi:hypothetical protein M9H77_06085 [Catharanthus roseus]|uniref:Uncharacterized protein n=1 Tax=Catharanthus roseus TaxID=4058 RepID=A0ACC0BR89_CATRO|nr:hypothetical protein M9H77_06085 [Catharanthus roseus]
MKILFVFLTIALCTYGEAHNTYQFQETKMTIYSHSISTGPNATGVTVAGIPGEHWEILKFGNVYVADEPIKEGISQNSKQIARCRGLYVTASRDGETLHATYSMRFTDEIYGGSKLEFQGSYGVSDTLREIPIVGGAGKFRLARGYVIWETVQEEPFVERGNITVLHPILTH